MSGITISNELLQHPELTLADKMVASYVADGKFVSVIEIATALSTARMTVYRSLKTLVGLGILKVLTKGVHGCTYELSIRTDLT